MNTGRLLLGIVGGAAAGALLGVLFAPDKGSETRRKVFQRRNELRDAAGELKDVAREKLNTVTGNISSGLKNVKNQASYIADKARNIENSINKPEHHNKEGKATNPSGPIKKIPTV